MATQNNYPFGLTFNSYQKENSVDQKYKFNGIEEQSDLELNILQTYFRSYDPSIARFLQVDPLADIIPGTSPFQFGFNNPLTFADPLGLMGETRGLMGETRGADGLTDSEWVAFSRPGGATELERESINTQRRKEKEDNSQPRITVDGKTVTDEDTEIFRFVDGNKIHVFYASFFLDNKPSGNGAPCPKCLDPSTVGNWFYIYGGPNNPKSNDGKYNYDLSPKNISDKQAYVHDKDYDDKGAVGGLDLVLNFSVIQADMKFVKNQLAISGLYATQFRPVAGNVWIYTPTIDPITNKPISFGTAVDAFIQGVGLGIITAPKILIHGLLTNPPPLIGK